MKHAALLTALILFLLPFVSLKAQSPYLFVWAGDDDEQDSDFLAVIDARPDTPTYGQVIATLPVRARSTFPHHTEYEFPTRSILFANGWGAGQTFLINLKDPKRPRLESYFERHR